MTDAKSKFNWALTSDKDFDENTLTGEKESVYGISNIDISNVTTPVKIQTYRIDLDFKNDSNFRILDFKRSILELTQKSSKIYLPYASTDIESK